MSNNASQSTDSQKQVVDDAASFTSATSTLYDGKSSSTTKKSSKKSKGTKLDASATSFAKKAGEEGWSAPTATRPSMGC
ncbi:hypothetical protein TRAPUB_10477 [Trametes pubescens]|uniref:Uncharacterized protein n=1 Tax=Trametes pubescens TaxID=154538 RepID=A0A1M2VZP0_TRAPU|nr:hypothetical protein TRAPUB_10477 [Trametes pubescens]